MQILYSFVDFSHFIIACNEEDEEKNGNQFQCYVLMTGYCCKFISITERDDTHQLKIAHIKQSRQKKEKIIATNLANLTGYIIEYGANVNK